MRLVSDLNRSYTVGMSELAEYAVKILKQYADENHTTVRGTSDLSPLEEWLIIQLHNKQ